MNFAWKERKNLFFENDIATNCRPLRDSIANSHGLKEREIQTYLTSNNILCCLFRPFFGSFIACLGECDKNVYTKVCLS